MTRHGGQVKDRFGSMSTF